MPRSFDFMEFDNDCFYFDAEKYTKEQALELYNKISGLDPASIEDVEERRVRWKVKDPDYPDGCYEDCTNASHSYPSFKAWRI